jgi:acetylglutamate kinase
VQHNYASPIVVKYGGAALANVSEPRGVEGPAIPSDPVLSEIAALTADGTPVVLVHGGGPEIDRELSARGIATQRLDGQRVTGADALGVVEAVLCGTLNKRLVRALCALGARATGISGEDACTLVARRALGPRGADLGYVGEIASCDPRLLELLLHHRFVPVVAPLAISRDARHAFNVNADLAAAAIAAELRARAFVVITNVARVLRDVDDPGSGIDRLTAAEARSFAASDACRDSMKPKLVAAAVAVEAGAGAAYVAAAKPQAIAAALAGDATIVTADSS